MGFLVQILNISEDSVGVQLWGKLLDTRLYGKQAVLEKPAPVTGQKRTGLKTDLHSSSRTQRRRNNIARQLTDLCTLFPRPPYCLPDTPTVAVTSSNL